MRKINFINPFHKSFWTGGIKTTYQHAEILWKNGFEVCIYQPDGMPDAAPECLRPFVGSEIFEGDDYVTVFPEIINREMRQIAGNDKIKNKYIFCQNQYYFYTYMPSIPVLRDLGIRGVFCPSERSKKSLMETLGIRSSDIYVLPCVVDRTLFRTHDIKKNQIVTASRKWPYADGIPNYATLLQNMFCLKYPDLAQISWITLENQPQLAVVEAFNTSTVFLSLSRLESLGLTPLEAMSSRCLVVGYHGGGGLEYATPQNGFWFSPEQHEEVVDTLALAVTGLHARNPVLKRMLDAGEETAGMFGEEAARAALLRTYGKLCQK